ncbi:MAG: hypothetical protein MJ016_03220 [Victivallaceae bacterium]|nr:hypothetical protein [Victivallaceae bacterium]
MQRISFITGNSFPMNLIRRHVECIPQTFEEYLRRLQTGNWMSFWGHRNTLEAVNQMTGFDLTPQTERPALTLDDEFFPNLNGIRYRECWILSPIYQSGFRPAVGEEVSAEKITGWNVLKMLW